MRKLALWIVPLFAVGLGCSARQAEDAADQAAPRADDAANTAEHAVEEVAHHGPEGVSEGEMITVAGTLGCAHCTHQIGTTCAAAIQTAEGVVYILDGVAADSELFEKRYDGTVVTVVGTPSEQDGAHHVAVTSYQM